MSTDGSLDKKVETELNSITCKDVSIAHGTNVSGIKRFRKADNPRIAAGVYFTSWLSSIAEDFAVRRTESRGLRGDRPTVYYAEVPDVKLVDLRDERTLETVLQGFADYVEKTDERRANAVRIKVEKDQHKEKGLAEVMIGVQDRFTEYLQSLGYDGLVCVEEREIERVKEPDYQFYYTEEQYEKLHCKYDSIVVFDPEKIKIVEEKELSKKDIEYNRWDRGMPVQTRNAIFLSAIAEVVNDVIAENCNYDWRDWVESDLIKPIIEVYDRATYDKHKDEVLSKKLISLKGDIGEIVNNLQFTRIGDPNYMDHRYDHRLEQFSEWLEQKGFNIERKDINPTLTAGIHKPAIFDLKYNGRSVQTIVHKDFNDAKPEKLNHEYLLTELLIGVSLDDHTVNVPHINGLGDAYSSGCTYSVFEPNYTVEEALKKGREFNEGKVIDSIVDFGVIGAFHLASRASWQLDSWDVFNHAKCDFSEIQKARNARDLVTILEDLTSEDRNVDENEFRHLSSRPNENYKTAFRRRMQRIGIEDEFIDMFTEKYIDPIMKGGRKTLSHNDLHIGNIFTQGKIIDLEAAGYGEFGTDIARYLISKYTQTYSQIEDLTIQDIIEENQAMIRRAVDRYNKAINAVDEVYAKNIDDPSYARVGKMLGLEELSYEEFNAALEGMMKHSALSRVSQRIYDYEQTDSAEFLGLAADNFDIFYSSLNEEEKRTFDKDSRKACPTLKALMNVYKEKALAA
ncbi:hypothetical protein KY343_02410 [Candidatus Woesearchaeota archaeon]|nr:hypothetical protein [Candidatus Woesearchaeota archaeon]